VCIWCPVKSSCLDNTLTFQKRVVRPSWSESKVRFTMLMFVDALCIRATTNAGVLQLRFRMTAKNKQRPPVPRSSLPVFSFAKRTSDSPPLMQSVIHTFATSALRRNPGLLSHYFLANERTKITMFHRSSVFSRSPSPDICPLPFLMM